VWVVWSTGGGGSKPAPVNYYLSWTPDAGRTWFHSVIDADPLWPGAIPLPPDPNPPCTTPYDNFEDGPPINIPGSPIIRVAFSPAFDNVVIAYAKWSENGYRIKVVVPNGSSGLETDVSIAELGITSLVVTPGADGPLFNDISPPRPEDHYYVEWAPAISVHPGVYEPDPFDPTVGPIPLINHIAVSWYSTVESYATEYTSVWAGVTETGPIDWKVSRISNPNGCPGPSGFEEMICPRKIGPRIL